MRPAIQRMSGFDAGYFYSETAEAHQYNIATVVLAQHPALGFERFAAAVEARLDVLPPLRRRVVKVPFALHHPLWVNSTTVEVTRHVHRTRVGGAGSRRDLDVLVGEIASSGLDQRHPLWEVHYCEGLADGQVAVVAKMHHSLADGYAINALLDLVVDVPAGELGVPEPTATTDRLPGRWELVRTGLRDSLAQLGRLPGLLRRMISGGRAAGAYRREHRVTPLKPILSSPRLSFNGHLTARRTVATASLPMADLRAVRAQHPGTTLNDVVLGTVSGALRRWLEAHGERPSRSLTTGVPIGLKEDGPRRLSGNRLSTVFATLATDVDDPSERLAAIATTMRHAKEMNRLSGPTTMMDLFEFVPGGPVSLAVRAHAALRLANRHPAPFCLQVSNLAGPPEPVTIGGVPVTELSLCGPPVEGNGLTVVVWSYADRLSFSLIACPDLLPDVEVLATYLPSALADYQRGSSS